ncbi:30S ribosomal protein S12 methylthiotransferase RimO, partial [bacterium]|nr:30S ribosomal protein S12 methylthiotransferase RimO [candidate division CSSED10-310 bacterium]
PTRDTIGRSVYIITLGCPKNTVDAELMAAALNRAGWRLTTEPAGADVLVVNTCGFIAAAREESIDTILRLAAETDNRRIVVAGCMAERFGDELHRELHEAAAVVGPGFIESMPAILEEVLTGGRPLHTGRPPVLALADGGRLPSTPRTHAYLKISDGCDNRCAYCAIPLIRGRLRSRSIDEVIAEARGLAAAGFGELILIAQDTAAYGRDRDDGTGIAGLLRELDNLDGDFTVRLMYAHPAHVTAELVNLFGSSRRLAPYIDLPIQHAADDVLRRMGRGYGRDRIEELLAAFRLVRPDMVFRTTVLVGFPGETDENFAELRRFLGASGFHHLGVFTYSKETGTAAARAAGKVPAMVAAERRDLLMEDHRERSRRWLAEYVGKVLEVSIDGVSEESEHLLQGRAAWQAPEVDGVILINDGWAEIGTNAPVRISESFDYDLLGSVVERSRDAAAPPDPP